MDLWRAERLNAPSDFMKAPDGATVSNPTPSLMTPAQFAGSPLVPPSAPHTTPVQAPPLPAAPQTTPFRAPLPSLFVGEGLGFTESSGVEVRRPIHHKHQSEKISQQRSDHRLSEDERSSSEALREVGRLKEEKEAMRREMEHLRGRVECLREQIKDQQSQINRQCTERDELHSELKSCKTELGMRRDELSALKSEHDLERQRLEKELQDSKEETERLQSKLEEQNVTPDAVRDVTSLRAQVQEVMSERDELKNQLSALNSSLSEHSECVQKLRRYIGSSTTERREEEELKQQIQQLEKEKEALSLSVQLLNVRVNAANDILAIQEKELEEQEQSDPLYSGSKAGQMLGVWRQKVFTLLVKLQTRDLQLHTEKTQLQNMVSSLQQEVECLQSQISVLQHHLEDKTAQLELQHVHTQGLQQQLDSVLQENIHLIEMNKSTEGSLKDISETAHSVMSAVELKAGQMEAVQSSVSQLNQRLAFAAKRLDTVQGLLLRREALWKTRQAAKPPESSVSESFVKSLQSEVALLSSERDKLTQELKRTPALIQASLSELQQQQEKEVGLLKEAVLRSKEELEASESRQLEIQRHCEEQEGTIAELRAEAQRLQQQCDSVLLKVSEVESVCAEKLREMETQLNTARREHTKAVVALRQVQRQAEREKEQMKEAERERTEHTHTQFTHLQRRLKDKDKDRNLLRYTHSQSYLSSCCSFKGTAVVQEQGLMNQYKKLRKSAIQTVEASKPKPHHQSESRNPSTPESLLGALQALSAAVMGSSEEEDDEEGQDSTVTQTPSCADTHKELC